MNLSAPISDWNGTTDVPVTENVTVSSTDQPVWTEGILNCLKAAWEYCLEHKFIVFPTGSVVLIIFIVVIVVCCVKKKRSRKKRSDKGMPNLHEIDRRLTQSEEGGDSVELTSINMNHQPSAPVHSQPEVWTTRFTDDGISNHQAENGDKSMTALQPPTSEQSKKTSIKTLSQKRRQVMKKGSTCSGKSVPPVPGYMDPLRANATRSIKRISGYFKGNKRGAGSDNTFGSGASAIDGTYVNVSKSSSSLNNKGTFPGVRAKFHNIKTVVRNSFRPKSSHVPEEDYLDMRGTGDSPVLNARAQQDKAVSEKDEDDSDKEDYYNMRQSLRLPPSITGEISAHKNWAKPNHRDKSSRKNYFTGEDTFTTPVDDDSDAEDYQNAAVAKAEAARKKASNLKPRYKYEEAAQFTGFDKESVDQEI